VLTVRKLLTAAVLIAHTFAAASTAETAAPSWQIVQKAGEVSVSTGGFFPVALKPEVALPEGAVVMTGPTGRAILRRGGEQIALDPKSRIVLAAGSSTATYIRQDAGSAFFSIGKRNAPHFEVGTPFLAAIVKGTSFRVNVNGAGAAVHVTEGAVEVATVYRSAVTLVRPGASALVRASGKAEIQLLKEGVPTRTVTADEGGWDTPDFEASTTDVADNVSPASLTGEAFNIDVAEAATPRGESLLRLSPGDGAAKSPRPRLLGATPKRGLDRPHDAVAETTGRVEIAPLGLAKPAPSATRPSRAQRDKPDGELPMREIGLSLLALFLLMLANHFRSLRHARVQRRR
jgi:hypothetical protein